MTHRVAITPTATREFRRLGREMQQRVGAVLKSLGENPRPSGVVKLAGSQSDWRVRVGSYRILYEIDDVSRVVTVWRIAHRGRAYR